MTAALGRRALLLGAGASLAAARALAQGTLDVGALRGALSATDLGLRTGAPDDQSAAFQRAVDAAAAQGLPLFVPPGRYIIARVRLPDGLLVLGVPGASRLVHAGGGPLLLCEGANRLGFDGIVLDGAGLPLGNGTGLLQLFEVADVTVRGVEITGSAGSALAMERCGGRVLDSRFTNAADAGIGSTDARGLTISGNTVEDCGDYGIMVHRWELAEDGTIVSANRVSRVLARSGGTGQYGNGIHVINAANVVVSANQVADCRLSSIRAFSSRDVLIDGNNCLRSGETGIFAEFAFDGAVITDNLVDGSTGGISIANFSSGGRLAVCSGNLVRNTTDVPPYHWEDGGFGVGISVEADVTVTGNVVENLALDGIQIGWGPYMRNVIATGNMVRQARYGITVSVVEDAGAALVADNLIAESREAAIMGMRWADSATGDLASGGAEAFPNLTIDGNRVA